MYCRDLPSPVLGHDEALQRGVTRQAKDCQKEAAHEVAQDDVKDGGNDGALGWIDGAVKSLLV